LKNEFILTILGLVLIVTPGHSAKQNDLRKECASANFTKPGRPVMFPPHDGLSMGISTPRLTFQVSDPVLIYVWVNNQTNEEKVLMSCSMWWDWGIEVYDSGWHAIKTKAEQNSESVPICGRNLSLHIPPHSCGLLQDMGDVAIDLQTDRILPSGNYFVTEKGLAPPMRGLSIAIADK
jgi:hypothetical protein